MLKYKERKFEKVEDWLRLGYFGYWGNVRRKCKLQVRFTSSGDGYFDFSTQVGVKYMFNEKISVSEIYD